jgi:hypothetical protein
VEVGCSGKALLGILVVTNREPRSPVPSASYPSLRGVGNGSPAKLSTGAVMQVSVGQASQERLSLCVY